MTAAFLLTLVSIRAYSQTNGESLSLQELTPNGTVPTVASDILTHSFTGTAVDTVHNLIYLKLNRKLWTYSISQNQWIKMDSLPIDYNLNDMAYDPLHRRLLFWDRGVGRVIARTDSGAYQRLDHSFRQRNQYGHLGWFDPLTDRIYAFGGYGLFTAKNIVTYYDSSAREWFLLDVADPGMIPAEQTGAMGVFDAEDNMLTMIGTTKNNQTALWELSLSNKSWKLIGYLNPDIQKYYSHDFNFDYWYNSYIPSHHLEIFPVIDDEHQRDIRLAAFDMESNKLTYLPLRGLALPSGTDCANIIWIRNLQSLLLVLWKFMPTQTHYRAFIYKIRINNLDELSLYVNTRYDHLLIYPSIFSRSEIKRLLYLAIGCMLGIGFMLVFLFFGKKGLFKKRLKTDNRIDSQQISRIPDMADDSHNERISVPPSLPDDKLTIILYPAIQFYYKGNYTMDDLPNSENRLLMLLASHMLTSNHYVLTDEIDSTLWPNHTSPDYVRKARNKTIERLEKTLRRIAPLDEITNYILRRNYVYDNRKAEFALNSEVCQVLNDPAN